MLGVPSADDGSLFCLATKRWCKDGFWHLLAKDVLCANGTIVAKVAKVAIVAKVARAKGPPGCEQWLWPSWQRSSSFLASANFYVYLSLAKKKRGQEWPSLKKLALTTFSLQKKDTLVFRCKKLGLNNDCGNSLWNKKEVMDTFSRMNYFEKDKSYTVTFACAKNLENLKEKWQKF